MPAVHYMLAAFEKYVNGGGAVTKTMIADWKRLLAESAKLGIYDLFPPALWLHSKRPMLRFLGALLCAAFKPSLTASEAIAVSGAMTWAGSTQIPHWVLAFHEGSIAHLTTAEHQIAMQDLQDEPMRCMLESISAFNQAKTLLDRAAAFMTMGRDVALQPFSARRIVNVETFSVFAFIVRSWPLLASLPPSSHPPSDWRPRRSLPPYPPPTSNAARPSAIHHLTQTRRASRPPATL